MSKIRDMVEEAQRPSPSKMHKYSSVDMFRDEILNFIVGQTSQIQEDDELLKQVKASLAEKVELHELDTQELMSLMRGLNESGNKRIDSLFRIFQPTPNTSNPLLPPSEEQGALGTEDITPEERNALHKLQMLMEKASKDGQENE